MKCVRVRNELTRKSRVPASTNFAEHYQKPNILLKMVNKNIDLQTHTTASDGKLTPAELVSLAIKNKLAAIAITDHDSVNGLDEAIKAAKEDIEIIPGVEISCDDKGYVD